MARLTGAAAKNPQRYRSRREPLVAEPLGDPPDWLAVPQRRVWRDFEKRLPWLNRSHRCITAIACILEAKMRAGTLGLPGMTLLKVTLGQMCATPTTAGKIRMPAPPEEADDLLD